MIRRMAWVAFGLIRTTYKWDKECGLPCIVVSFEGLQTSAVPRADCREVVWSSLRSSGVCFAFAICFCFTGQSRTAQEYVEVGVQSPAYIGYSPADDLCVDCRRMGFFVSDSFFGAFPNPVPATLEIRAL